MPSRTHCQETGSRKINEGSAKEVRESSSEVSLQLREMEGRKKGNTVLRVCNQYVQNREAEDSEWKGSWFGCRVQCLGAVVRFVHC